MEFLNTALAFVVGVGIIPLVAGLKNTVVVKYVRPEFLTGLLAVGAAFGLTALFNIELIPAETVQLALAAVGGTSIVYGGMKTVKKKG